MNRSVFNFSICLVVAIFCLWCPVVQSELENGMLIEQITNKGSNDVCKGVSTPSSCPINCFRVDPVCGVDGITYWCGCADAMCSKAAVAKKGACDLENGGSGSLPRQALLLVHILWLFLLGFSLLFGFF